MASGTGFLQGRVAVVTGGGRGIGAATAHALADAGAAVAVLARSQEEVKAVVGALRGSGTRALAVPCDVADGEALRRAFAAVEHELGPIDVLINNAAVVSPVGPTARVDPDAWTGALAINLMAPFVAIKRVLPGMLERRWGRIVNVTTGAAAGTGMIHANAYSVSKAGLEMLTLNLATELAGTGVTINAVRPGTVDSAMQTYLRTRSPEEAGADLVANFRRIQETGRLIDPSLPGRLICRLVEQDGTGEIISISDARGQALLASG